MTQRGWVLIVLGIVFVFAEGVSQRVFLQDAFPRLTFRRCLFLTHSGDQSDRLFVVRQEGFIHVLGKNSLVTEAPVFLDVSRKISSANYEEGLLGLAFPPDFRTRKVFYVNYTAPSTLSPSGIKTVVARYAVSSSDPNSADSTSEKIVLEIEQPGVAHNGGMLAFGPDGTLFISAGDGGTSYDSLKNAQSLTSLLGKILRIDVRVDSGYAIPPDNPFAGNASGIKEEIWAYGFRNPWRFSFDSATGQLWAGDVGAETREEIDLVVPGGNYGWNIMEGSICGPSQGGNCDTTGLIMPVKDYDRNLGYSVTGGYIYRGSSVPQLRGAYIYADYGSGQIFLLRYEGGMVTADSVLLDTHFRISSFGVDENHELYVVAHNTGKVLKLTGGVGSTSAGMPDAPVLYALQQNYPNPFNPSTVIEYTIGEGRNRSGPETHVRLSVFDVLGREIAVLVNANQAAGIHTLTWDAEGVAGGVYFYRLTAGGFSETKKLMLLR